MNKYLEHLLNNIPGLTKDDHYYLSQSLTVKTLNKGTTLVRQGDFIDKCYYIFDGCIREYKIDEEGNERTTNFYFREDTVAVFNEEDIKKASKVFWECSIDSVILLGDLSVEDEVLEKFPQLEGFIRKILENNIGRIQDDLQFFIESTPQERVHKLLTKHPELFDFAPQYQIASYLGLTPESLSRIKKRLL